MKKIKCLYLLFLCTIFIPKVYAFTYDIEPKVDSTNVDVGTLTEVSIYLKNVQGLTEGFGACSMKLNLSDSISLTSNVRGSDGWSVTSGNIYAFDTSSGFVSDSKMFVIPVKIDGDGVIKISEIKCSDGNSNVPITDKTINFTVNKMPSNSNVSGGESAGDLGSGVELPSCAELSEITLSSGTIDFDPNVMEYNVSVDDFDKLDVLVKLECATSSYSIDKNTTDGEESVMITVTSFDGETKTYLINVSEEQQSSSTSLGNEDTTNEESSNNKFVPIFVAIIVLLLFVNVFRIVRNRKR